MDSDYELERRIVSALRRIMRGVELHSSRLVESCGLTGPQLAVLRAVESGGPAPLGQVAREVHLSHATVSGIVNRLAAQDLMHRVRSESDLRSVLLTITPRGAEVVQSAPPLLQDRFRAALHALESWERTQILATLERIGVLMGVDDVDAAPHLDVRENLAEGAGK